MKVNPKAVGRLIVTLLLMGLAIGFMFKFPAYSWSAVLFIALIVIWDFMYYNDFKYFKLGESGIEAIANVKSDSQKAGQVSKKINYHQRLEDIQLPPGDVHFIGSYREPLGLNKFSDLVNEAKEAGYVLEEDNTYLNIAGDFQRSVVNQLLSSLEVKGWEFDYIELDKYRQRLFEVLYESSFDIKTFENLQEELVAKHGHQKAIAHRFNRAINDLKRIEA